jgi:Subtilase family
MEMTPNRAEEARGLLGLNAWPRLDPYLVWAWLTAFRDYLAPGAQRNVAVAIQSEDSVAKLAERIKKTDPTVTLNPLYTRQREPVVEPQQCHFCTAIVPVEALLRLLGLATRVELGTAVVTREPLAALTVNPSPASTVVGVIDDFVAFAHPCFANSDHSRVTHIWSQDALPPRALEPKQWVATPDIGYGYELTTLLPDASDLSTLRNAYPIVLPRVSHGTPVACLAAGNQVGLAPVSDVDIVAVHLPRNVVADTSGGAFTVQALDGIRYIMDRAGAAKNAVVNLSYGTMAGPHDGTSIFEMAIDELIELRMNKLVVVLPAGNAYEARCHACLELTLQSPDAELHWVVPPDCRAPTFMEIWLPGDVSADVSVAVTDPFQETVGPAFAPAVLADAPNWADASFGVVYLPQVANGLNGTMILIALAPTGASGTSRPLARHGLWRVELHSRAGTDIRAVHAWIQRDDTLQGFPPGGRQSYFVDPAYEMPGHVPDEPSDNAASVTKRAGSFNPYATGQHTIVVGGYVGSPESRHYAPGSGGGPMRGGTRHGPDVTAPAEKSRVLHGVRMAANRAADTVRANGTSIATPYATRLIAALPKLGSLTPDGIRTELAKMTCHAPSTKEPPDPEREGKGRLC